MTQSNLMSLFEKLSLDLVRRTLVTFRPSPKVEVSEAYLEDLIDKIRDLETDRAYLEGQVEELEDELSECDCD
jgi:cell division septum initiation protein DivIVA